NGQPTSGDDPAGNGTVAAAGNGIVAAAGNGIVAAAGSGIVAATHAVVGGMLALIQAWLDDTGLADSRLGLLTHQPVATHPRPDPPNLAHAAVWGLVRSAQTETPPQFPLIDPDPPHAATQLPTALATNEPQLAIHDGTLHPPRLTAAQPTPTVGDPPAAARLDPQRTVLIT